MFNKRVIFTVFFVVFAVVVIIYGAGFISVSTFINPNNQSHWLDFTKMDLDNVRKINFEGEETTVTTIALRQSDIIYSTTLGALVRLESGRYAGHFFLRESSGCPT